MTINETQDEIIEEFVELEDWMDRYQLLIDMGEEQEPLPDGEKTEQNLIDGCQSRVWIVCDRGADGRLTFRAESDALIVKGIVSLVIRVFIPHRKSSMPTFISSPASASPNTFRPHVPTVCLP